MKSDSDISARTIIVRSSALIGSKAIQDGLLSILFIWLARTNQSGFGLIILGSSIAALLRSIQSMGLDQYTLREFSASPSLSSHFLRQMSWIKIQIFLLAAVCFFCFAFLKNWPSTQIIITTILISSQLFEGITDTVFSLFRAEGQIVNESVCRTIPNILAAVYGAFCLYFQLDIIFFSFLFFINGFLKLVAAMVGARKLRSFSISTDKPNKLLPEQVQSLIRVIVISFFGMFYNEIQIFWIKQYYSFTDITYYKTAFDITTFVCSAVAHLIVGAVLFPQLVSLFANKKDEKFRRIVQVYFRKIIALGSGLAVFLSLFGGKLVFLIYGTHYLPAKTLVPIFAFAAFFSFINNFIIYVMLAMRQEKNLLLFLCVPVSISVLMGPTLIATTGPLGAALSLLLCRALFSIFLITFIQKRIQLFKLAEYKNIAAYWLIAATIFLLLGQFSYFISSRLALFVYFLLLWKYFEIFKQKKRNNVCD